jgi:predicted unusual protein kinase regulating ubiquinone biosynthesis (AarF/ABC1/UbiB family)
MKKEQTKIPVSKIKRASKFVKSGMKVGGNYLKHYSKKLVNPDLSRDKLDEANAAEIYDTLSELKGSALKVAQTLSMDKGVLPAAYSNKFIEAQYNAPALSGPLIVKTFRKNFGKAPQEIFDSFDMTAIHAASIGQVHQATKDGKTLAVKIQYPGVGDSVVSDLNMVRPFARQIMGFKDSEVEVYFEEVKDRLLEETDYELELNRGQMLSEKCSHLPNLFFPKYFPEYSSSRVITMEWLEGMHLDKFLATNPSQEILDKAGQALWDFYNFQLHKLNIMHADAHPGNFLFREDGTVGILDFGCVKEIPYDFYQSYFKLIQPGILNDREAFIEACREAELILENDKEEDINFIMEIFHEAMGLVCQPFHTDEFDFGDESYFAKIYEYGEATAGNKEIRKQPPRGSKHGLYMNRAFFGLYSILNQLKAKVETRKYLV